jgi:hypothetical protein
MSAMSNYLENALINATLRNTSYTSPAAVYVALFSTYTEGGTVTEISGSGYSRQSAAWDAPADGVSVNTADVTFTATADYTAAACGIYDASTAGNLLFAANIPSFTVTASESLVFEAGSLAVTLT